MRATSQLIFLLLGTFGTAEKNTPFVRGGIRNDAGRFHKLKAGYISCPVCADENGRDWMSRPEFSLDDDALYSRYTEMRDCDDPDSSSSLTLYSFAYDRQRCVKLDMFEVDSSVIPTGKVGQIRLSYSLFLKFTEQAKVSASASQGSSWKFERTPNFLLNITTCGLSEVECFTDDFIRYHKDANFEIPVRLEASTVPSPTISYEQLQQKLTDTEKRLQFKQAELAESQKEFKRIEHSNHAALKENNALQLEIRSLHRNLSILEKQVSPWPVNQEAAGLKVERDDARNKILKLIQDVLACREEAASNLERIQNVTSTLRSLEKKFSDARINHTTASDAWNKEKEELEKQQRLSSERINGLLDTVKDYKDKLEQSNVAVVQPKEESVKHEQICSKQIKSSEDDLGALRKNVSLLQELVKQVEDEKAEATKGREECSLAAEKLGNEKNVLLHEAKSLNASLSALQNSFEKYHNQMEATRMELAVSKGTIEILTAELSASTTGVTRLEAIRSSLRADLQKAETEIKNIEGVLATTNASLAEKDQELADCLTNASLVTEMNWRMGDQLGELKTTAISFAFELLDTTTCSRQIKIALVTITMLMLAGILLSAVFIILYCTKRKKAENLPSLETLTESPCLPDEDECVTEL